MVSLPGALKILNTALSVTEPEQRAAGVAVTGAATLNPPLTVAGAIEFHRESGIDPRDYEDPQNYAEDVVAEVYDFDTEDAERLVELLRERGVL